ncbi:unnamed protein product [Danaus chrysippus]|uniref:(African queen) hypothetical protein n=1 Tax=Danaus chrysippus TaxID=151541 RepID=A0A8J2QH07_9NEOP|nr:unnamed protein product [Danaus chrysippus]
MARRRDGERRRAKTAARTSVVMARSASLNAWARYSEARRVFARHYDYIPGCQHFLPLNHVLFSYCMLCARPVFTVGDCFGYSTIRRVPRAPVTKPGEDWQLRRLNNSSVRLKIQIL